MNVLVIYDSYFGNTEQIARAIGRALEPAQRVEVLGADKVTPASLKAVDLLIVGSPTRQFRATKGVTQLLNSLGPRDLAGVKVAAFDTRLALEKVESGVARWFIRTGGFAARGIAKLLTRSGGQLVAPPEGFDVDGEQGPLSAGELERAADWAIRISAEGVPVQS